MTSGTAWLSTSGPFLAFLAIGFVAHEIWRWLGVGASRGLTPDHPVVGWVRAVSTALVAALVARLIVFPIGALAETAPWVRAAGLVAGLAALYLSGGRLMIAIGASVVIFLLGAMVS